MPKVLLSLYVICLCFQQVNAQDFNTAYETITPTSNLPLTSWSVPNINFRPDGVFLRAGDINADGKDDLVLFFGRQFIANELTESPSDLTNKSLVFFGGNTSNVPDQVIHAELSPVGDLNGDGFSDAIGQNLDNTIHYYFGSADGFIIHDQVQSDFLTYLTPQGFKDFNGDGFGDVLIQNVTLPVQNFTILFGGNTIRDFAFQDYSLEDATFLIPVSLEKDMLASIRLVNINDMIQTATLGINSEDLSLQISNQQALLYETPNDYSGGQLLLNSIDVNGDGLEEIYIPEVQESETEVSNILFEASANGYTNFTLLNTRLTEAPWLTVGDLNGDQRGDFARLDGVVLEIAFTPEDIAIGLTATQTDIDLSEATPIMEVNISVSEIEPSFYALGDYNGDGLSDFYIKQKSDEIINYKVIYGNDQREVSNDHDATFNLSEFNFLPQYLESTTIGDLNQDGIEDLALLFSDKTEIYYGGVFNETPDISFPSAMKLNSNFEVGDFNGDNRLDLAIASYTPGPAFRVDGESQVNIYFGKDNFDGIADVTLEGIFLPPTSLFTKIFLIHNIGDFNHDNSDDFVISYITSDITYVTYLIYGGDDISVSNGRKFQVPIYNMSEENLFPNNPVLGWDLQALGDINNDGIDDFAISEFATYHVSPDVTNSGAIFIYYGSQHTPGSINVGQPDMILKLEDREFQDFEFFGYRLVAGDFNGDGYNDLLTCSRRMTGVAGTTAEGRDGFLIYHGGPAFDNQYDQKFALPALPFGNEAVTKINTYLGELRAIPDINADGADEIYSATPEGRFTNAIVIMGGNGISTDLIPAIRFEAPNQGASLGLGRIRTSAIGDFNGDGITELMLSQHSDRNYRNTPIYTYPVATPFLVTSVEETDVQNGISLYPNPAQNELTVSMKNLAGYQLQSLNLINLDGSIINTVSLSPQQQEVKLNVTSLKEGMYLVLIHTDKGTLTRKVLKQH